MGRELVHDLATDTYEYVEFVSVLTRSPHVRSVALPFSYVDHTDPSRAFGGQRISPRMKIKTRSLDSEPFRARPLPLCASLVRTFRSHHGFAHHMKRAFTDCIKVKSATVAAQKVEQASQRLKEHGYSYAMPDDQICDLAKNKARDHLLAIARCSDDSETRFAKAQALLSNLGLGFADSYIDAKRKANELHSLVARACDEIWLRRQLRKKCAFQLEQIARDLELVQRAKQPYCSDYSVQRQRDQKKRNRAMLENMVVYDKANPEQFHELSDIHDHSIANPEIRRGEMFTRLRGFEEIAKEQGHDALFLTITAPSRFHPVSKGKQNKKWIEAGKPSARDAHVHLMTVWKQFRKDINKAGIKVYGMRIVEPHQDGTPHHHFLLFCHSTASKHVTNLMLHHAMRDTPNERGAKKHRFTVEKIDFSRGSAIGYIAKYISKSIDGKHVDKDLKTNLDGIELAERITSFARVNGIRQFQFVGGPPVSVWRNMRRLRNEFKEDDAMFTDLDTTEHFQLETIRKAADAGDWKAFCYAMGGVFVKRGEEAVKIAYDAPKTIEKLLMSGELSTTRYGDMAHAKIMGLMFKDVFLATRFADFAIENKEKYLAAQKQIMDGTSDFFDVLEREQHYQRMNEIAYEKHLAHIEFCEEIKAMVLTGVPEEIISAYVSRAAADIG